jgi:hypothetical protein
MHPITQKFARKLIARIVEQPESRAALIRFIYYTEEFVERFDVEPVLPHLDDEEKKALLHHFHDEKAHARAMRKYCQENGMDVERSPGEEALIRRSDEGYAQYLQHLDPATNRFTPEEMYAYYAHVGMQEDIANHAYLLVADELERIGHDPKFAKLLRAFARSEMKHQDYAIDFMAKYERILGKRKCKAISRRIRWWSVRSGTRFGWEFLRLLRKEHRFDAGPLSVVLN